MSRFNHKILCVEDDKDTCELITFIFSQQGYEVSSCTQKECLKMFYRQKFSAIILNNYHAGIKGTEICREIRVTDRTIPIIFLSGEGRYAEIEKVMAAGASAYLVKPNGLDCLIDTVTTLVEQWEEIEAESASENSVSILQRLR